jgi:hypothetical protein
MNASTKQLRKCLFVAGFVFLFVVLVLIQKQDKFTNENSSKTQSYEIIKTKCDYGESGPRILCAIYTHKAIHNTTLLFAHNTWAKRFFTFLKSIWNEIGKLNFNFVNYTILKMR